MRKTSKQAASAFINGKNFKSGNTEVQVDDNSVNLVLHGTKIAKQSEEGLFLTLAGFNTTVTKERLNALLSAMGFREGYHTVRGRAMVSGNKIDENAWQRFSREPQPVCL